MKKQSSFMHRILAIILVLLIAVTGLFSLSNNSIDVEAVGDSGGGSGGGNFNGTGAGSGTINGVGWRFTLVSDDIIASNRGTCVDDLNAYLSNKISMSIVVTSYTNTISKFVGRGDTATKQKSVRSIKNIFPDINASGFTADFQSGAKL